MARRDPLDRYYTPGWLADMACSIVLPTIGVEPRTVLEPAAGGGAFVKSLLYNAKRPVMIESVDIDESVVATHHCNYLEWAPSQTYDLAITNPPYKLAELFARKMLHEACNVVLLLRLNWLASRGRYEFFQQHQPSHVFISPTRPSFTGRGTDSTEYCYVCWAHAAMGGTELHWLQPRAKS